MPNGLPEKIRAVIEWWPAVVILQEVLAAAPGREQAVAVGKLLAFAASRSDVTFDDELAAKLQAVIATKEGGELVDYVVSLARHTGV